MTFEELSALPVIVSVAVAARALGIGRNKAYELIHAGEFPVKILALGDSMKVPTANLRAVLGVEPTAA